jgi:hypothetical protein
MKYLLAATFGLLVRRGFSNRVAHIGKQGAESLGDANPNDERNTDGYISGVIIPNRMDLKMQHDAERLRQEKRDP